MLQAKLNRVFFPRYFFLLQARSLGCGFSRLEKVSQKKPRRSDFVPKLDKLGKVKLWTISAFPFGTSPQESKFAHNSHKTRNFEQTSKCPLLRHRKVHHKILDTFHQFHLSIRFQDICSVISPITKSSTIIVCISRISSLSQPQTPTVITISNFRI